MNEKIRGAQEVLKKEGIDGWLLYDFRRTNDLACTFLEIPQNVMLTRRAFYWVPKDGDPVKIVSAIETAVLDHLPGKLRTYRTWQELETLLGDILKGSKTVAMEYSPRNAVPYVSKVDAGTMEVVRGFGVEVVSSADLLQQYTSVWDEEMLALHLEAAEILDNAVAEAWEWIAKEMDRGITEYDVQQLILDKFRQNHCITEGDPICALNAHSADPHFSPSKENSQTIRPGDFILIDLWCKKDAPKATYADITRVGVAAASPTELQQEIFSIVKEARDAAANLVSGRFAKEEPLMGWEVDQAARDVIEEAGYGEYFIHRTGHNIDEKDHGSGAHIDNYETQERRKILAGTCFSIEPGIYLPGEFGVRLEYDLYVHPDGKVQITGGVQNTIQLLG